MLLASWNVNSIRARHGRFMRWMRRLRASLDRRYRAAEPVILCGDFEILAASFDR